MGIENNILKEKIEFAVDTVLVSCKYVQRNFREYDLTKQLIRSITSIGANYTEASIALTTKDFIHLINICRKECAESMYWIERINKLNYLQAEEYSGAKDMLIEVYKILNASFSTARRNYRARKVN